MALLASRVGDPVRLALDPSLLSTMDTLRIQTATSIDGGNMSDSSFSSDNAGLSSSVSTSDMTSDATTPATTPPAEDCSSFVLPANLKPPALVLDAVSASLAPLLTPKHLRAVPILESGAEGGYTTDTDPESNARRRRRIVKRLPSYRRSLCARPEFRHASLPLVPETGTPVVSASSRRRAQSDARSTDQHDANTPKVELPLSGLIMNSNPTFGIWPSGECSPPAPPPTRRDTPIPFSRDHVPPQRLVLQPQSAPTSRDTPKPLARSLGSPQRGSNPPPVMHRDNRPPNIPLPPPPRLDAKAIQHLKTPALPEQRSETPNPARLTSSSTCGSPAAVCPPRPSLAAVLDAGLATPSPVPELPALGNGLGRGRPPTRRPEAARTYTAPLEHSARVTVNGTQSTRRSSIRLGRSFTPATPPARFNSGALATPPLFSPVSLYHRRTPWLLSPAANSPTTVTIPSATRAPQTAALMMRRPHAVRLNTISPTDALLANLPAGRERSIRDELPIASRTWQERLSLVPSEPALMSPAGSSEVSSLASPEYANSQLVAAQTEAKKKLILHKVVSLSAFNPYFASAAADQ
ncbi:hypothetical protein BKA62DRAFT_795357 [Auriculariales sp. MPI-PUGE-AT-0066]|nr:hypothetical protein BKA62DRAFT_795357 [Auriculariales sp. MPI-PUGE-AT-0066]